MNSEVFNLAFSIESNQRVQVREAFDRLLIIHKYSFPIVAPWKTDSLFLEVELNSDFESFEAALPIKGFGWVHQSRAPCVYRLPSIVEYNTVGAFSLVINIDKVMFIWDVGVR